MTVKTDCQSTLIRARTLVTQIHTLVHDCFTAYGNTPESHHFRGYINVDTWITKLAEAASGLLVTSLTVDASLT